jgi:hypothetical protein
LCLLLVFKITSCAAFSPFFKVFLCLFIPNTPDFQLYLIGGIEKWTSTSSCQRQEPYFKNHFKVHLKGKRETIGTVAHLPYCYESGIHNW